MSKNFKALGAKNVNDNEVCYDLSQNPAFFECSKCSFTIMKFVAGERCPLCGRKIVKENK